MKVLHIIPTYIPAFNHGGPVSSVHYINKILVKNGIEVTVYTTNINGQGHLDVIPDQKYEIDGVGVYYFPVTFRPWEYSYGMHKTLAKNIKNFDLVHITSVFLSVSTLGSYYSNKYKKPFIISPRGALMAEPLSRKSPLKKKIYLSLFEKRNLKTASAIHFTSKKEKEEYLSAGFPSQESFIIPNCFDVEEFHDIEIKYGVFREKFNIKPEAKVVLFLGRLSWKKGLDTLIPSFYRAIKEEPEAILVIAGPDDEGYSREIKKQISDLRLNDKVIFTGMLLGQDKVSAYKDANVFVLPSYSENFGMTVVEALAMNLPVIISKEVGISEEVEKAKAGLVIEKNVNETAAAILKILKNPSLAITMGNRGGELVKNEFPFDKITERFINQYQDVVKGYSQS